MCTCLASNIGSRARNRAVCVLVLDVNYGISVKAFVFICQFDLYISVYEASTWNSSVTNVNITTQSEEPDYVANEAGKSIMSAMFRGDQ